MTLGIYRQMCVNQEIPIEISKIITYSFIFNTMYNLQTAIKIKALQIKPDNVVLI